MDRADNLLTELLRLASLPDTHGSQDAHVHELASTAARLLRARSSTFLWLHEEHCLPDPDAKMRRFNAQDAVDREVVFKRVTVGEPSTGSPAPSCTVPDALRRLSNSPDNSLCSPIRSSGHVIALLHVSGPLAKPQFDHEDLRLLDLVAVYVGKSLQVSQLQNVLHSRFAQIALAQSVENTVGQVLAAAHHPAGIVRILAKSFYREMNRMGFGANDIINAASEIISELSGSLKRHARRHEGKPA
jgi:L-methionine (R)-S-oxide reductase